jgi:hypothetical protein
MSQTAIAAALMMLYAGCPIEFRLIQLIDPARCKAIVDTNIAASDHPRLSSPRRNAPRVAFEIGSSSAWPTITPMRRICWPCCARATRDQTAAAPPRSVMKSRRLTWASSAWRRRSVYRTLNLPQRGPQVLGDDLNCSESRWGAAKR